MDGFLELLVLLAAWRVAACFAGSITLAILLSNSFENFTAGYCIILVFIGIGFGIFWQDRADVERSKK
jgi:hypothetical protein